MNSERKLTVSLVVWNGARYLPFCLQSLADQSFQDFDLAIRDNGSQDSSFAICESFAQKFPGRFALRRNSSNEGFDKPHNEAMKESSSPYVMLLNQDVILDSRYLERCVEFLDSHADAGSVSGKILRWYLSFEPKSNALIQSEKTTTIDSLGLQIFRSGRAIERRVGAADSPDFSGDEEVFGVSGTVPVYRKAALESVAFEGLYFDNDFFAYKEDVDLAFRLRWAGWTSYVVGSAVAYHDRTMKSLEGLGLMEQIRRRRSQSRISRRNSYRNHLWMLRKNISSGLWKRLKYPIISEELKKFLFIFFCEWGTLVKLAEVFKTRARTHAKRNAVMSARKVTNEEMLNWFN